jgi:hypothetical protein
VICLTPHLLALLQSEFHPTARAQTFDFSKQTIRVAGRFDVIIRSSFQSANGAFGVLAMRADKLIHPPYLIEVNYKPLKLAVKIAAALEKAIFKLQTKSEARSFNRRSSPRGASA